MIPARTHLRGQSPPSPTSPSPREWPLRAWCDIIATSSCPPPTTARATTLPCHWHLCSRPPGHPAPAPPSPLPRETSQPTPIETPPLPALPLPPSCRGHRPGGGGLWGVGLGYAVPPPPSYFSPSARSPPPFAVAPPARTHAMRGWAEGGPHPIRRPPHSPPATQPPHHRLAAPPSRPPHIPPPLPLHSLRVGWPSVEGSGRPLVARVPRHQHSKFPSRLPFPPEARKQLIAPSQTACKCVFLEKFADNVTPRVEGRAGSPPGPTPPQKPIPRVGWCLP